MHFCLGVFIHGRFTDIYIGLTLEAFALESIEWFVLAASTLCSEAGQSKWMTHFNLFIPIDTRQNPSPFMSVCNLHK